MLQWWTLGQCLPPTCPSSVPATVLAAVNYGGSSGYSSRRGPGCLMARWLVAEPGCAYQGLGSSLGCRPSFVGESGAQRPLWSPLNCGAAEEDWVLLPPPGPAHGCHHKAGAITRQVPSWGGPLVPEMAPQWGLWAWQGRESPRVLWSACEEGQPSCRPHQWGKALWGPVAVALDGLRPVSTPLTQPQRSEGCSLAPEENSGAEVSWVLL